MSVLYMNQLLQQPPSCTRLWGFPSVLSGASVTSCCYWSLACRRRISKPCADLIGIGLFPSRVSARSACSIPAFGDLRPMAWASCTANDSSGRTQAVCFSLRMDCPWGDGGVSCWRTCRLSSLGQLVAGRVYRCGFDPVQSLPELCCSPSAPALVLSLSNPAISSGLLAIMKFSLVLLALASTAVAVPTTDGSSLKRQSPESIVDQLMFGISLPQFTARRNKKDPPNLDWSSDGCTSSPDNPFGFPYLPACQRHDFGYQNFRIQKRFTKAAKAKIDTNFKNDLYFQCGQVSAKKACEALADVYYAAVRRFGGGDATKRETQEELNKAYDEAVVAYNAAVKEAQEEGLLPVLD
ncbi:hypothetical protein TOPH_03264 [Tolypocladium ophioglossoides CBS 100239]|uniref:Secretory phospholipase A2 n=1 Tax=Tolypocladium ophioglossoides (strain CBS 100239) TaxID=1163406 RepID=A0A0L0NCI1_TOLOC|nr:hypothetical protein TOPH_03264 [Tolypocladium ophioglossoides CBS 100239]